ncbi:MAG: HAD family phosphatase [Bacilli bacterium]|nr:HAD family phosphatase [Bacilli bacterium]
MIKAVIFDIGNVIFNFDIDNVIIKYTDNEEERKFIKEEIYRSPEWTGMGLIDIGYISLDEAASQIKDRTNHTHDDLVDNFLSDYVSYGFIDRRVIDLMYKLRDNGYKVYILSNISKEIFDGFNIRDVLSNIDGYVLSYEYHQIKPYKSIYEILINKYNINPEEAIFIDDKKENLDTANKLGIKGHHVIKNDYNSIIDLLREYNVVR